MGRRLYPRTLGRIRISCHLLDDADHRPWLRQFFSLGFITLRVQDSYLNHYVEMVIDYDKLPAVDMGAIIPLYNVLVHTVEGKVADFEFILVDEDNDIFYGTDHIQFSTRVLSSPRANPVAAQDAGGKNDPGDAGPGNASPPVDGQAGVGPTKTEGG